MTVFIILSKSIIQLFLQVGHRSELTPLEGQQVKLNKYICIMVVDRKLISTYRWIQIQRFFFWKKCFETKIIRFLLLFLLNLSSFISQTSDAFKRIIDYLLVLSCFPPQKISHFKICYTVVCTCLQRYDTYKINQFWMKTKSTVVFYYN